MNRPRLEQLRQFLLELPDDRFRYECYFSDSEAYDDPVLIRNPECQTAACVGGWVIALFGCGPVRTPSVDAQRLLDLNDQEAGFLFLTCINHSSRQDAIRRIDHLLSWKPLDEYDWNLEDNGAFKSRVLQREQR